MKKLIYYFLYPFNKLYDLFYEACDHYESGKKVVYQHKVIYLVIGYYLNDEEYDICAVCDDRVLSEHFADDLRRLDKYFRVSICDYTLNQLNII